VNRGERAPLDALAFATVIALAWSLWNRPLAAWLFPRLEPVLPWWALKPVLYVDWLLALVAGGAVLTRLGRRLPRPPFGLSRRVLQGIGVGILSSLPMALLMGSAVRWRMNLDLQELTAAALLPGFMEELFFRAFFFGWLFRLARAGFLLSVATASIAFSVGHLYQAHSPLEAGLVLLVTGAGAAWFAWLYVEWEYNLWVPITLHILMNAWWLLFDGGASAVGGGIENLARSLTIALSIALTLRMARLRGRRNVNRVTLWPGAAPP